MAIMDWYSRKVLAWRLSNTMDAEFCVEALATHGTPEIFNTDQGSQFTSALWVEVLSDAKIKISMPLGDFTNHLPIIDGKGRWIDNRMIERLWRPLKYECVYLHACDHFFFMLALWCEGVSQPPTSFKNINRFMREMSQRKAVQNVCEIEGISLDRYSG